MPSTEPGAKKLRRMRLMERLLGLARGAVFGFFWSSGLVGYLSMMC